MLPTASLTISELLSGPFLLNVPVYQRPYSWGREQAEQLLEDLIEAAGLGANVEPDPDYFLGTILLMDSPGNVTTRLSPKITTREFDIVDGQQRLVTMQTLFSVLRDLEAHAKKPMGKRVQGIVTAQQGARFFRTERTRIHIASKDQAFFDKHVLQPGATLKEAEGDELSPSESALIAVREHFARELQEMPEAARDALFAYAADNCFVVVIVSHDIDRAHRTFIVLNERGKKLQRNDILKADVLSRLPAASLPLGVKIWDDVSAELGNDFEKFFAHLRTIYGYTRPEIVSGVRSVVRDAGGADVFLGAVFLPLSKPYKLICTNGEGVLPSTMVRHLKYLNRLSDADWGPAAMIALKDWEADPAGAERALAEIDRLAHLSRMLCMGGGKRVRRFAELVGLLQSGETLSSSSPPLQLTREETRNISFHLKDMHKRNQKTCKLVLLRLSDEIDGAHASVNPEDYTIEHVLPQRTSATSEWRRWFPSPDDRGRLVESIGNLVLITQKQNQKAKNASFVTKKEIYATPEAGRPLLAITQDIMDAEQWQAAEIAAREERLLKTLERIWRLDLGTAKPSAGAVAQTPDRPGPRPLPN